MLNIIILGLTVYLLIQVKYDKSNAYNDILICPVYEVHMVKFTGQTPKFRASADLLTYLRYENDSVKISKTGEKAPNQAKKKGKMQNFQLKIIGIPIKIDNSHVCNLIHTYTKKINK